MTTPVEILEIRTALGEASDCTVVALSLAANVTYFKARSVLMKNGRKNRHGATIETQNKSYADLGINLVEWPVKARTIKTLPKELPNDYTFLVYTTRFRHVLCIKNGNVLDWTEGRRHRVELVLLVERS